MTSLYKYDSLAVNIERVCYDGRKIIFTELVDWLGVILCVITNGATCSDFFGDLFLMRLDTKVKPIYLEEKCTYTVHNSTYTARNYHILSCVNIPPSQSTNCVNMSWHGIPF